MENKPQVLASRALNAAMIAEKYGCEDLADALLSLSTAMLFAAANVQIEDTDKGKFLVVGTLKWGGCEGKLLHLHPTVPTRIKAFLFRFPWISELMCDFFIHLGDGNRPSKDANFSSFPVKIGLDHGGVDLDLGGRKVVPITQHVVNLASRSRCFHAG